MWSRQEVINPVVIATDFILKSYMYLAVPPRNIKFFFRQFSYIISKIKTCVLLQGVRNIKGNQWKFVCGNNVWKEKLLNVPFKIRTGLLIASSII